MLDTVRALDPLVRYSLFAFANVLLFVWARYIVAPAKVGWTRFILALPLFLLCLFISYLFRFGTEAEEGLVMHIVTNYLWLTVWKSIGLCLNRGQLTKAYHSGSLAAFAVALCCPVNVAFQEHPIDVAKKDGVVKSEQNQIAHPFEDVKFSVVRLKGRALLKEIVNSVCNVVVLLVLSVLLGVMCIKYEDYTFPQSFILSWMCLFFVSIFQDFNMMLCLLTLGIKLGVNFDKPYLATSMTEFWSKRWNLVMGEQLRSIIYNPIVESKMIADERYYNKPQPSRLRLGVGVVCAFLASGVIHAVLLMQLVDSTAIPVLYALFFCAHSAVVVLEKMVKYVSKGSVRYQKVIDSIPDVVKIAYVHAVLSVTAHYLFWPDVITFGLKDENLNAVLAFAPRFLYKPE